MLSEVAFYTKKPLSTGFLSAQKSGSFLGKLSVTQRLNIYENTLYEVELLQSTVEQREPRFADFSYCS